MDFFPYSYRKNQKAILSEIASKVSQKSHVVLESGTGSGKTVCALAATIPYALEQGKKIVYTTRTNAQQRQVILELRALKKHCGDDTLFGIGVQGRTNMCLLAKHNPELQNGTSEELSRYCAAQKKKALSGKKQQGCQYYQTYLGDKPCVEQIIQTTKDQLPTAEELIALCERQQICPYEISKLLLDQATLVVVPYVYIFDKTIRIMLFDWLSISEEDIILIVDEAHNLPDYLRELFSAQLSYWMLTSCITEAEKYGDPQIANLELQVSQFCKILRDILMDLRDTYIYNLLENNVRKPSVEHQDAFIPSHELETEIYSRLKITSRHLKDIVSDLIAFGEKIREYRQKEEKLPRSYLHKLGVFLEFWITIELDQYIKLVVDDSNGRNPRVEAYCVDPSLGARIIKEFHASVHMSGTLEPLEEYRDSLGLGAETQLVAYPSPFPTENRKILYVRDVTTKYDDLMKDPHIVGRMWRHISQVCNCFPRNTMVFFPSFNILQLFNKKGRFGDIRRHLFIEEQSMSQAELMDLVSDFKSFGDTENNGGAALFSVIGGRISEGMDFPAEQLEIALLVGIPYPKPTARQRGLQQYYELKFGKGWEYTVEAPTARKILQSIGRLIRNEQDRGVAVILDRRAQRFKKYLKDLQVSHDICKDISSFLVSDN